MVVNLKYALAHRVAQIVSSAITILLIPIYFNTVEVGLYYLLMSFIGFPVMFEVGMGQALIQVASHINRNERFSRGYCAFIKTISRDYRTISNNFFVVALLLGVPYIFIFVPSEFYYSVVVFIAVTVATTVVLRLSYVHSILESRGCINYSNKIKFKSIILATITFWICIFFKFGLFSLGVSLAANATYLNWALRRLSFGGRGKIINPLDNSPNYLNELTALQSRFKISYISGYLASGAIIPIVFAMISPVDAGRLGISLSLFSAVTVIASVFVVVNNVRMSSLISNNKIKELHYLFIRLIKLVVSAGVLLGGAALALIYLLRLFFPLVAYKFMEFELLSLLCISSISSALIYSMAIYIRAHKIELLVGSSVLSAISVVLFVIAGSFYGLNYVVYGYASSSFFISMPLTYIIFRRKYKENSERTLIDGIKF